MNEHQQWLDLTTESALEPDLPICDPHHHLWDYSGSRYLTAEFLQDLAPELTPELTSSHRIVSSVFMECLQFYETAR